MNSQSKDQSLNNPVKKSVAVKDAPNPLGAYSHAIQLGSLLFIAGQGSRSAKTGVEAGLTLSEKGEVISYDIALQTEAVLNNLEHVLKSAGATLEQVVDVTVFLKDMADFDAYNRVYNKRFNGDTPPARTTVQVAGLPGKNFIEIKAIAYLSSI